MAQVDCWSCKQLPSIRPDDDLQEQVLMLERGELPLVSLSGPLAHPYSTHRRSDPEKTAAVTRIKGLLGKLGRNLSVTVAALSQVIATESSSKQSLKDECRKLAWSSVIKALMQQHPGSQLPERLISSIRKHFDSLPLTYARAGFTSEQVFLHIRLLDQALLERSNLPVCVQAQQCGPRFSNSSQSSSNLTSPSSSHSWDDDDPTMVDFALTFACSGSVSRSAVVLALNQADISVKHFQLFEKKAVSLAILAIQASRDSIQPEKIEQIVRKAVQKSKTSKFNLTFRSLEKSDHARAALVDGRRMGEQNKDPDLDVQMHRSSHSGVVDPPIDLTSPQNIQILIDENQGIISGRDELHPWLLDPAKMEVGELLIHNSGAAIHRGVYDSRQVTLKQLNLRKSAKNLSEFELKTEILDLDARPHKNILPSLGIFIDNRHRIYAVNKFVDGECLREYLRQRKGARVADKVKLAIDIAEGMRFLHQRSIVHRDLSAENIFVDSRGSAIVRGPDAAQFIPEDGRMAHEAGSYHSIAPEVLRSASDKTTASPKSNVYSFGIILWEMLTLETPYLDYSPAQAALAIVAHGLRPTIPVDCYPPLRYLMQHCWSSNPSDRPDFTAILEILRLAYKNLSRPTAKTGRS